jgi:ribosomal protein L37AE/L43A
VTRAVAEKKAKTAEKSSADQQRKHLCPSCGAESRVVQYTGFGPRGFFWVCEKTCGYTKRTR